ncbi:LOW QUALITY PROTEIN: glucose-6-phosphate exchanger SLC37A2-like [Haliotis rubra]|uniref:LOW QUALITY PROTEIN: glucose-6-phosphate exchanger SLC37A2-like n=1 Tax=Haliotis rubra TaxID=36100 RepID=UPI001EE62B02|nr:LOW QUALITY PROTEIN: glucose-6-phosphate exchanger SLC37A2-like [Haliotis rubra]
MSKVPPGFRVLPRTGCNRNVAYRLFIIVFTFFCYTCYHLSRKPISVVKSVFHRNCSHFLFPSNENISNYKTWCDWAPFDQNNYEELLGSLDYAFLFSNAICMFISGHIAERMNLRYFLALGMLGTGAATAMFGLGYFLNIHSLAFYVIVQIVAGALQSTGWPSVVACMGNWYGKGKRGLIMGLWNSHTSVGNILGSVIPGIFVDHSWGWSFVVPGIIIAVFGVLTFFFLVPKPEDVGCSLPDHQGTSVVANVEVDVEVEATPTSSKYDDPDRDDQPLLKKKEDKAITILDAMRIPGVVEFALCLFFAKLVSYTFLFWLPKYISAKTSYSAQTSADLSALFDVGGIVGGILAGVISDFTGARASTCMVMLFLAAPMMYVYDLFGSLDYTRNICLLMVVGALVNGPYALITTAVSADLGTHRSLQGNAKAVATVTAFIDGTGSIGAALGPLLTGLISPTGWNNVFYMLIAADLAALLLLIRLVTKEIMAHVASRRARRRDHIQ